MKRNPLPLLGLILLFFLPACDVGDDDDAADDDDVADDDAVDDDDSSTDDDDSSTDDDVPGAIPVGSNVLLLIADDLGLDGASFDSKSPCFPVGNASDDAPMPNLAALCASGVRFENAWAMPGKAFSIPGPAWAANMTGRRLKASPSPCWRASRQATRPAGFCAFPRSRGLCS